MKRQLVIFLVASLLVGAVGLALNARAAVDLAIFYPTTIDSGGTKIMLRPDPAVPLSANMQKHYLLEARRIVAERLQQLAPLPASDVVLAQGCLIVELPPEDGIQNIMGIISRVGEVEFIDGGTLSPPLGQYVETGPETIPEQNVYQTLFTGHEIRSIVPPNVNDGQVFYQIKPVSAAAERFDQFLRAQRAGYLCVVVDRQVANCSKMYHWSGDTLDILPDLSDSAGIDVAELAILLESGPLPISLKVVTN